MPDRLIPVPLPASELGRIVREAEVRGGRWFTFEVAAELALWRDLEPFGAERPPTRSLASRWGIPQPTVSRLIRKLLSSPVDGTSTIAEVVNHPPGHPGAATLENIAPRHLLTIVEEKVAMNGGLARIVERARGVAREDIVSEVYAKCLERQRTDGSYWQPHRAGLGAWVYAVTRGHLINLGKVIPQPSVAADVEGLIRAAERTPTPWCDKPR
jgi:hypothetical protein